MSFPAGVAALADAPGLGPGGLRLLEVRLLSPASQSTVRSDELEEPGDLDPPLFVAVRATA
jgi:hypothetical protein